MMRILDQLDKHVAIESIQLECEIAHLPRALAVEMVSTSVGSAPDQSKRWITLTWISIVITLILFSGLVYMAPATNV